MEGPLLGAYYASDSDMRLHANATPSQHRYILTQNKVHACVH